MGIELRPQGCMACQRNWAETGVALTQNVSESGGGTAMKVRKRDGTKLQRAPNTQ